MRFDPSPTPRTLSGVRRVVGTRPVLRARSGGNSTVQFRCADDACLPHVTICLFHCTHLAVELVTLSTAVLVAATANR